MGDLQTAIPVPTDNGLGVSAVVVKDGTHHGRRGTHDAGAGVGKESFHAMPTVVLAAGTAGGLKINFLAGGLADVADDEIASEPVEAPTPRVAQAVGPDFGAEWIGGRNPVTGVGVDIETEHFAEQGTEGLGIVRRVARAAAVAGAGVELEEAVGGIAGMKGQP